MTDPFIPLDRLPRLADLFQLFNSGKHLNRTAEPALWAELEREQPAYEALFSALGYQLRVDRRGFAWFHNDEASSNVNKATRQLALLFMVLFNVQADAGRLLQHFEGWVIDAQLLNAVHDQYRDLLSAEGLNAEALRGLMDTAVRYGFATTDNAAWRLQPAVCRYLDHFEELARQVKHDDRSQRLEAHEPEDVGDDPGDGA